jgi:hypothetical protein
LTGSEKENSSETSKCNVVQSVNNDNTVKLLMKKFVQFALLITIMMLLNIVGHMIGLLFVEEYNKYALSFHFWESLFLISVYSVFQIFVFPINKKYWEFIIPLFTLLVFAFILFSQDSDGFGGEIVHIVVSLGSKIVYILYFLVAYNAENESSRIFLVGLLHCFGYVIYLYVVFSSFKYVLKFLAKRYPFFSTSAQA